MAKFKPPKTTKTGAKSWRGVLPCLFLLLMLFGLIMALFYWGLKG